VPAWLGSLTATRPAWWSRELEQGADSLDPELSARVTQAAGEAVSRHAALLEARRAASRVRQCHGDLHLRNIVLLDGRPTLFDGIEFNDDIACIDVLYDVAFLLMDLWRRDLTSHANVVFKEYVTATDDLDGLPLLPAVPVLPCHRTGEDKHHRR
jgi:aminoglycoside phosphotransferase family enzyme